MLSHECRDVNVYSLIALEQVERIEKELIRNSIEFCTLFTPINGGQGTEYACKIQINTKGRSKDRKQFSLIMFPETPYLVTPKLLIESNDKDKNQILHKMELVDIIQYIKSHTLIS